MNYSNTLNYSVSPVMYNNKCYVLIVQKRHVQRILHQIFSSRDSMHQNNFISMYK